MIALEDDALRDSVISPHIVNNEIKVIFIAGMERSGTTLLGRLLAKEGDSIHVGEIKEIWTGLSRGHLCECMLPIAECPFWSEVFRNAFGRISELDIEKLVRTTHSIESIRLNAGRSLLSITKQFQADQNYLTDVLGRLYKAVREASDSRLIIDSSKRQHYANLIQTIPEITLLPVHIIRDCRAVAFSMQRLRKDPAKPKSSGTPRHNPIRTSVAWVAANSLLQINPINQNQVSIRYEDFVENPHQTLASMSDWLDLSHLSNLTQGSSVHCARGHSIAGNPSRFNPEIKLEPDTEWQSAMPAVTRLACTVIGAPILSKYKYFG